VSKRIFVIGATGVVGGRAVPLLIAAEIDVTAERQRLRKSAGRGLV
jgi:uncharacterized protein YbjT (DUF2867 family)